MSTTKVQMKEALSQFVDFLVEEELGVIREELSKFRSDLQIEIKAIKDSVDDSIKEIQKKSDREISKVRESLSVMAEELATLKSEQISYVDSELKTLDSRLSNQVKNVAADSADKTADLQRMLKDLSRRVDGAEKVSTLLNSFAANLSSVASPKREEDYQAPAAPRDPVEEEAPSQTDDLSIEDVGDVDFSSITDNDEDVDFSSLSDNSEDVDLCIQSDSSKGKAIPELSLEESFLDSFIVDSDDAGDIDDSYNPIIVDEISGQQLYKP